MFTTCGHSFCTQCIENLIENKEQVFCPIDQTQHQIYEWDQGLKCFPVNHHILKILRDLKKDLPYDICIQHGKSLEMVCKYDYTLICSDCILFGWHKGHSYSKGEEFIEYLKEYTELKLELIHKEHARFDEFYDELKQDIKESKANHSQKIILFF